MRIIRLGTKSAAEGKAVVRRGTIAPQTYHPGSVPGRLLLEERIQGICAHARRGRTCWNAYRLQRWKLGRARRMRRRGRSRRAPAGRDRAFALGQDRVHHLARAQLLAGNALPFFEPLAQGRIVRAYLEPQPDDAVPRFDYEGNLAKLTSGEPNGPKARARSASCASPSNTSPRRTVWRALGSGNAAPRHRRLPRRMAARSAAARFEL